MKLRKRGRPGLALAGAAARHGVPTRPPKDCRGQRCRPGDHPTSAATPAPEGHSARGATPDGQRLLGSAPPNAAPGRTLGAQQHWRQHPPALGRPASAPADAVAAGGPGEAPRGPRPARGRIGTAGPRRTSPSSGTCSRRAAPPAPEASEAPAFWPPRGLARQAVGGPAPHRPLTGPSGRSPGRAAARYGGNPAPAPSAPSARTSWP